MSRSGRFRVWVESISRSIDFVLPCLSLIISKSVSAVVSSFPLHVVHYYFTLSMQASTTAHLEKDGRRDFIIPTTCVSFDFRELIKHCFCITQCIRFLFVLSVVFIESGLHWFCLSPFNYRNELWFINEHTLPHV